MTSTYPLAGLVAGTAAWRVGVSGRESLTLAAVLFLTQFGAFVLLCAPGVPAPASQGAAIALGVVVVAGS